MKKVIIIGALAFLAYTYRDKIFGKKDTVSTPSEPAEEVENDYNNFFGNYDKKVVVEPKGYYTVVENGKLRPAGQADLSKYEVVEIDFAVWEYYIENNPELIVKA